MSLRSKQIWETLVVSLFFLSAIASADADLDHARVEQLEKAQAVLQDRLTLLDSYDKLRDGVPPESEGQKSGAIERYLQAVQVAKSSAVNGKVSEDCERFFKVQSDLRDDIRKHVFIFKSKSFKDKHRLLQSRVEILGQITSQVYQWAANDSEGSVGSILGNKFQCVGQKREAWKFSLQDEINALNDLQISLFGVRGLANVYEVAGSLAELNLENARSDLHWIGPKLVAGVAIPVAGWEILGVQLGRLVWAGYMTSRAAMVVRPIPFVIAGSYFGAKTGGQMSIGTLIDGTDWEETMRSAENFVSLNFDSPLAYYPLSLQIEKSIAKALTNGANELVDAKGKWGSLDAAKMANANRLKKVQDALAKKLAAPRG